MNTSTSTSQKKSKKVGKVSNGVVHIGTTFNNIIITISDIFGNTLVSGSAGKFGFKGAKKSTPFAAQVVSEGVAKEARDVFGLKTVIVLIKGPGPGRESAIRALAVNGLIVTMIKDITSLPHNGCRRPKKRRV